MRFAPLAAALLMAAAVTPGPFGARVSARAAQHETSADVQDGGRVFRNSCANCHGPDGDQIAGIDLGRGVFRSDLSDADLVRIIRTGIPNTPMPPTNMSEEQASRVVAYLRATAATSRSTSAAGDAARGEAIFKGQGGCAGCHRVGTTGSRLGPELSRIGRVRRAIELERSLVDPAAEVQPTARFYRVMSKEGAVITGRLLNLDTFTVQLMDQEERLRSFAKAELREHGWAATPMPSYKDRLTSGELADVVAYLVSLKGAGR